MPSSCWANSCAFVQSPLASHHNPMTACVSPAGGSGAASDWRISSTVIVPPWSNAGVLVLLACEYINKLRCAYCSCTVTIPDEENSMANLAGVVQQLRKERAQAARTVEQLDA